MLRFIIALLALLPTLVHAQTSAPAWQRVFNNPRNNPHLDGRVQAAAVDAFGNVFVTGFFAHSVDFGRTHLTSRGTSDFFLAKWDVQAQKWAWATSGGGSGFDAGYGIAVSGRSVYVTGDFLCRGDVRIARKTLRGAGGYDLFVAKFTDTSTERQGSFTSDWATSGGGSKNDSGTAIAVLGQQVYVTGTFCSGTGARIAGRQLPGIGGYDIFVAKYLDTSTGNKSSFAPAWVMSDGGTGYDYSTAIAVNGTGVYITGYFPSGSAVRIAGQALAGAGSWDMFVAKYRDTSSPTAPSVAAGWATSGGGSDEDHGYGIAVSGRNVYVTGDVWSSAKTRVAGQQLRGAGSGDLFLAKYTDTGAHTFANDWALNDGGPHKEEGKALAVSGNNIYVLGNFFAGTGTRIARQPLKGAEGSDVFVAKYVTSSKSRGISGSWATWRGGDAYDESSAIALHGRRIYVTGAIFPLATLGSGTIDRSTYEQPNFLNCLVDAPRSIP